MIKNKRLGLCCAAACFLGLAGCAGKITGEAGMGSVHAIDYTITAAPEAESSYPSPANKALFQEFLMNMPIVEAGAYESYYGLMEWEGRFDETGAWSSYVSGAEAPPFSVGTGVLSAAAADLDKDGQDEMLLVRHGGADSSALSIHIYEADESKATKITETSSYNWYAGFPYAKSNYGYMDIFLTEANGILQIVLEKSQLSDHTSDGMSWNFLSLAYKNNQIIETEKMSLGDFGGWEYFGINGGLEKINKRIKDTGLRGEVKYPAYESRLIEANEGAVPILSLKNWSDYYYTSYSEDGSYSEETFYADALKSLTGSSFRMTPFVLLINDYSDLSGLASINPRSGLEYSPESVISKAEAEIPEKEKYKASMIMAYLKDESYFNNVTAEFNDDAFLAVVSDAYNAWDAELNRIYGKLKEKLTEEEFNELRDFQREWIRQRDYTSAGSVGIVAADEHPEWRFRTADMYSYLIKKTKERTLELVDVYFDGTDITHDVQIETIRYEDVDEARGVDVTIEYPEISGMADEDIQQKLNDAFKKHAFDYYSPDETYYYDGLFLHLEERFDYHIINNRILSVQLHTSYSNPDGAYPWSYMTARNIDLITGDLLELSDIAVLDDLKRAIISENPSYSVRGWSEAYPAEPFDDDQELREFGNWMDNLAENDSANFYLTPGRLGLIIEVHHAIGDFWVIEKQVEIDSDGRVIRFAQSDSNSIGAAADGELRPKLEALILVKNFLAGDSDDEFEPIDLENLSYTFSLNGGRYTIKYSTQSEDGSYIIDVHDADLANPEPFMADLFFVNIYTGEVTPISD